MQRTPGVIAGALLVAIWAYALIRFGGGGTEDFFGRWMHDAVIVVAALGCAAGARSSVAQTGSPGARWASACSPPRWAT
jgi:hypothetical protein